MVQNIISQECLEGLSSNLRQMSILPAKIKPVHLKVSRQRTTFLDKTPYANYDKNY